MSIRKTGRRGSKPTKTSTLMCDPGMCDECMYIGEGDFLCEKHQEVVVSDWTPTENYLMCKPGGETGGRT